MILRDNLGFVACVAKNNCTAGTFFKRYARRASAGREKRKMLLSMPSTVRTSPETSTRRIFNGLLRNYGVCRQHNLTFVGKMFHTTSRHPARREHFICFIQYRGLNAFRDTFLRRIWSKSRPSIRISMPDLRIPRESGTPPYTRKFFAVLFPNRRTPT